MSATSANKDPAQMDEAEFLDYLEKENLACTLFLVNGVKLQGTITSHGPSAIFLTRDHNVQMVYKHAISTVAKGSPAYSEPRMRNM